MGIENFIKDALHNPYDYIAYHVGRELAELHPDQAIGLWFWPRPTTRRNSIQRSSIGPAASIESTISIYRGHRSGPRTPLCGTKNCRLNWACQRTQSTVWC